MAKEPKKAVGPGPNGELPEDQVEDQVEKGEDDAEEQPAQKPDPVQFLRDQVRDLTRDLQTLRDSRRNETAPPGQPRKEEPDPELDKMLFEKPKEALAILRKSIKDEVTRELQSSYRQDQNTQQFWSGFFERHPDLRGDRDLVEVTLNSNLSELGGLKVEAASDRLADLTRERILRYQGPTDKTAKKKAQAEGNNPPRPGKKQSEPAKAVTLSEIIKARRAARSGPPPGNRGSAA